MLFRSELMLNGALARWKRDISTHSPFLLAFPGAKIINLDDHSRVADSWTQLKNPRVYYEFFKKHADEFEQEQ